MKSGILIVAKPSGMTSHDVIDEIRRMTGEQRVGHAGTLDPFATGVLVVGVGREATRVLGLISTTTEKSYRATLRLGAESDTDDREGRITERDEISQPKKSEVQAALKTFVGTIKQIPPVYSSIKVGGVRSYKRARRGEAVKLAERIVTVHSIHLRSYRLPFVEFDVVCSSGTYIRSIARDLGRALGTGAYLETLERTAVGMYTLHQATTLEALARNPQSSLLPTPAI